MTQDARTQSAPPRRQNLAGLTVARLGYLVLSGLVAWLAFAFMVTGLSTGSSLLIVLIGLPVLWLTVKVLAVLADGERFLLRSTLGQDAPSPRRRQPPAEAGWFRRMIAPFAEPQTWLDVCWSLVAPVVATITLSLAFSWLTFALASASWPLYGWATDSDPVVERFLADVGMGSYVARSAFFVLLGALAISATPWVVGGLTAVQSALSRALLCGRADLDAELAAVEQRRAAARSAELSSLRRLERDIHDGPQQRLVRMGMDLGRAEHLLESDPDRAREVIATAKQMSHQALEELRALSRGIAPPVLADRGLGAALEELAATSPLPVTLSCSPQADSLPPHLAHTAYFVAAEALANAAKHSGADQVTLDLWIGPDQVVLRVHDDGRGGAALGKGHGLAGLAERVAGSDGRLLVDSPDGGPTTIMAVWP